MISTAIDRNVRAATHILFLDSAGICAGHLTNIGVPADYSWKDDVSNDAENTPLLRQVAVGILNLSAALDPNENWRPRGGIKYVTDELFIRSGFSQPAVGFIVGSYNRGRKWDVTAEHKF